MPQSDTPPVIPTCSNCKHYFPETAHVGRCPQVFMFVMPHNEHQNIDGTVLMVRQEFEVAIKNSFEDELADVMIRVMDLAAFKGIDLEYHIKMKMAYNAMREHKHGKKY